MKKAIAIALTTATLALGSMVATTPKADAATVHYNGNKTTVHTNGYYYGPRVAPHKTTVKHNDKKDTVKVCREYIYGTKNCAKWSY